MGNSSNKPRYHPPSLIPPHGGYRDLKSYQMAEIIHDGTVVFCGRFIDSRSRTHDQMVQAARSGKQNIAEGSMASGTSRKTELKLVGVARAGGGTACQVARYLRWRACELRPTSRGNVSEELLLDFQDYLRQHGLPLWGKEHPQARKVRGLCYQKNRTYSTYRPHIDVPASAEIAANALICLIHQANYLLDRQLRALEQQFLKEGGFTEKLYHARQQMRNSGRKP